MPNMPPGALAATFSGLVEGLAADCERIANERENALRQENAQLRQENATLKERLGKANEDRDVSPGIKIEEKRHVGANDPSPLREEDLPTNNPIQDFPTIAKKGIFNVMPSLFAEKKILAEEFWHTEIVRPPDEDYFEFDASHATEDIQHQHIVRSRFVLDPGGMTKLAWDLFGIPVLAWDLITIPMQVFDLSDSSVMAIMGWVTLIYWSIDIPMTFRTGVFDREGTLIMDAWIIACQYLKGFLIMDTVIIGADWVSIVIEAAGSDAPPFLSNLGVLRALRITRFVRLLRLRKLKAKWQTIEDGIDNEWLLVCVNLFNKCMSIVALNHYFGCFFYALGKLSISGYDTWLTGTPFPQYWKKNREGHTVNDAPWGYQYLTALHWAITQFTPGSMHVQPQNIPERLFAIWCLLFGLVVFSAFIASVTQARLQLNKMMSKFERDLWLLRKYCRQNGVSRSLTLRMKRYVDLVLIPKFHKMSAKDVSLLPMLSMDLREELQTELASRQLRLHIFFETLEMKSKSNWNKSVMKKLCNKCVESRPLARGDIVFSCGELAADMVLVAATSLVYTPYMKKRDVAQVYKGTWLSEACLWTDWHRQGQLQARQESNSVTVQSSHFREVIQYHGLVQRYAKAYANAFLDGMNRFHQEEGNLPSDLQDAITAEINVRAIAEEAYSGSSSLKDSPTPDFVED